MAEHVQSFQLCLTLCNPKALCAWDFPGKNTGVGCHFLLQGIFPTHGLKPCLLLSKWILLPLGHLGIQKNYKNNFIAFLYTLSNQLQYFSHLMQRDNSSEKTLML